MIMKNTMTGLRFSTDKINGYPPPPSSILVYHVQKTLRIDSSEWRDLLKVSSGLYGSPWQATIPLDNETASLFLRLRISRPK